jgi:glycosyltransferase involved in cell wall biosynthesis
MNDSGKPLVTIAIPTYNRAGSFLPAALGSALAQSYTPVEIFVADNASSDATASLFRPIADKRLKYLRHPVNIGANRNFEFCLERARGDYFLLLHDDDMIDADFVSSCMAAAGHQVHDGIIRTGVRVIDESGVAVRESANDAMTTSLARYYQAWFSGRTCWYLVNSLFNTRRLREQGGFRSRYHLAEDGFAIARLARFHHIDVAEIKASFRVHRGEKTVAAPADAALWGREYLDLLDCMCAFVEPGDAAWLRRHGRRFFARLAYNRAALLPSAGARARAAYEVLRLFQYRCWPTHRSKALRLLSRARRSAQRRAGRLYAEIAGMSRRVQA